MWLQVDLEALDWLERSRPFDTLAQHHYRLHLAPKQSLRVSLAGKSGGFRPIEVPKPQLKQVQRRILDGLLTRLPTHPACMGFVRGRSTLIAARNTQVAPSWCASISLRSFPKGRPASSSSRFTQRPSPGHSAQQASPRRSRTDSRA